MTEPNALDPILAAISAQGVPIDEGFTQKLGELLTEQSLLTQGYFAQVMAGAAQVDDPLVAWRVVMDTWDELSADETLELVGVLMSRFAGEADPQAVDDPVDEEFDDEEEILGGKPGLDGTDINIMRDFLTRRGYDPQMLADAPDGTIRATVQNIMDKANQAHEDTPPPEPEAPRAVRVPAASALAAARPVAKKLPAKKAAAKRASRKPQGRIELGGPDFDPDNPFAAATPEVVLAAPLKTTAPRKGSGHKIPAGIDWPKDSRGRRVPPGSTKED